MGDISYESLYLESFFKTKMIQSFTFSQKPGNHATAMIRCVATRKSFDGNQDRGAYPVVKMMSDESDCPVYAGIIKDMEAEYDGEYVKIFIKAESGTYLLDLKKHCKIFQKMQGYKEVIKFVMADMGKAIYSIEEKIMDMPLCQYDETDWEFLKRIASRLGTSVVADINSVPLPRVYIGMRHGKYQGEFTTDCYKEMAWKRKGSLPVYEIYTRNDYKNGDCIQFNGKELYVCEKHGDLLDGGLMFRYVLSYAGYFDIPPYNNKNLHGKEITGKVIETKAEKLKIHFMIDAYGKSEISWFYKWLPETGNLLYCMPEIDSTVTLYFCNDGEDSGICINVARDENGKELKPENKYFTLPENKGVYYKPDKMKLGSDDINLEIYTKQGIRFNSTHEISIEAQGEIELSASEVLITAPKEIDVIREDILNPSVINMRDDFDSKGKIGRAEGILHFSDKTIPERIMVEKKNG